MQNAESSRNGICRKSIIMSCIAKQYKKNTKQQFDENPLALETIRRQGVIAFRKNTKKRCAFHDIRKNPRITSGPRGANRQNAGRIYFSASSIIWLIIGAAVSTGMANPSPSMPVPEPLATTMPISLPFWSKRPPPEFPGLIAESV